MDARLAIRRKTTFREEEQALVETLNRLDQVKLEAVELVHLYDVFSASPADLDSLQTAVLRDRRVDDLVTEHDLNRLLADPQSTSLAVEPLPGQYDQRADAAMQALRLLQPDTQATIFSAELYIFSPVPEPAALEAIRSFLINPVEAGEKDLSHLEAPSMGQVSALAQFPDFLELDEAGLKELLQSRGMAMNLNDLRQVQEYFRSEDRVPTEVELSVLDTYWSDHCRHTTFNTELTEVEIALDEADPLRPEIEAALAHWEQLRADNQRLHKPLTLMDLGTIVGRELRRSGKLDSQEVSEEINACSVHVTVTKADGSTEPWLLMFKNETHNHPTEIEPFGGAATCLGGAIRDPLSGRAWVYQALRLSGAGYINTPRSETLEGKLPQADISLRATQGYSSYGNQIGLATTHVHEFVHPGYTAKRMELGAVVAAAPAENVRREEPQVGDVVIILGGRTGRDGIGGATGSSKAHTEESLTSAGAEVQKGNPVNERKIQRLFRRPEVARLIVRCNDFGAGGVCVAVGELADSLDIHLDRVPLKYVGLNAREIAISESQERMAVVVRPQDVAAFQAAAREENLESTQLAEVTDTGRLRMFMHDELVLDLSRAFVDTNGAPRQQTVRIASPAATAWSPVVEYRSPSTPNHHAHEAVLDSLSRPGAGTQEGMVEQFDSTVGRSTVLMPFGGLCQKTKEIASIQTLPVEGVTNTASVVTYGYSPDLADVSPFLMGAYSVVEALAGLVAAGGDPARAWLTVQEYFQRPDDDPEVWGVVLQALLGLLEAQSAFEVAAIGGKDSMSGSFGEDLHVPPTLVTFAVGVLEATSAIPATLPIEDLDFYLLAHHPLASGTPNYAQLRANFSAFGRLRDAGLLRAASPLLQSGLVATVANMCAGNYLGFHSVENWDEVVAPHSGDAAKTALGGIVFAVPRNSELGEIENLVGLGHAELSSNILTFGSQFFTLLDAEQARDADYAEVYPLNDSLEEDLPHWATQLPPDATATSEPGADLEGEPHVETPATIVSQITPPHVLLPVFPGTNSEYDMAEAFRAAGATTEFLVIRNLDSQMLAEDTQSFIQKLREDRTRILAFSGGFSLGDEPDGSAKFMAAFLRSGQVSQAVKDFVARDGLVLGICNGFQALVKSGFLPYGDPDLLHDNSPTLAHNRQLRHVSRIATTRVATSGAKSPWLTSFAPGKIHRIPVSHGEGRFVVSEDQARELFAAGQVAFQYVNSEQIPTLAAPENPNGSSYAIEGIISPDGRILGKMGHPERYREGLMRNIVDIEVQNIFANAVNYCLRQASH